LLQIIGSAEVLGNPYGLIKNVGVGLFDVLDKPIDGFIKGPIEGTFGIIKGTTSLIKNTTSGVFNSLQKVSMSLGNGIS